MGEPAVTVMRMHDAPGALGGGAQRTSRRRTHSTKRAVFMASQPVAIVTQPSTRMRRSS